MCHSLFRSEPAMENATFYDHLLKMDRWRGLQLATAQMIISSSSSNNYLAGGDILRMANNIIKFNNMQASALIPSDQKERLHVLTLSMDDFVVSFRNVTLDYLDFVLGKGDEIVPKELRLRAVEERERLNSNKGTHVTQGKHTDRDELQLKLREDPILGPILHEVELLVNQALVQSKELIASL